MNKRANLRRAGAQIPAGARPESFRGREAPGVPAGDRIDARAQARSLWYPSWALPSEQFDRALHAVSSQLLSSRRQTFPARCTAALAAIGEFTGADLAMLYINPIGEQTRLSDHHRWARDGVDAAWDAVPGAPVMAFDYYAELLKRDKLVRVARVSEIPERAESEWIQIRRRGIKSVLMVRAFASHDAVGVLSLYALRHEVLWSDAQVVLARYGAALLGQSVARHVAERRRDEALEELRELELGVQKTQRLESLGVLAGGIAHDFNNLLTGVLGNAEIALLKAEDEQQRTRIERIRTAARRAAELTNQMLAYSGRGRFQLQPLDVNGVIRETRELLGATIPGSAELRLELGTSLPAVEVDPPQIRQVVMNLITNAAESLPEGKGTVTLSTDVVRYKAARRAGEQTLAPGSYVRLRVRDTGEGMDAATRERIFDPFFTTKFAGRGLGLAAVQGIVRGHRGGLWVESEAGSGTTFTVVLPKSERAPSGTYQAAELPAQEPVRRFAGQVLLADDEVHAQQATQAALEELGFEVQCAGDGIEAVARFQVDPSRYSAVVLDLTMPGAGGAEACTRIRALRADVPVLLMSGFDQSEVGSLVDAPDVAFVQKPVTLRALSGALETLVQPE